MTIEVQFPHEKMPAAQVMFDQNFVSTSGGVTITGGEQIVASSAGRWRATLGFEVALGASMIEEASRRSDTILVWRAIKSLLEGRTNILVIGPYDELNAPAGIAETNYGGNVLHNDAASFADNSRYNQSQTPARVAAAYAVGATSVSVDMLAGHSPEAGQYFSVLDRMFMIKRATASETANRWTLSVWPPAREAVTAAQVSAFLAAEFDRPKSKMRLMSDKTGELSLRGLYRSSPTIDLDEAP